MTRDRDGEVRLLLNRCTHRANQVCDFPSGNTTTFRCPYHGWTFANTGALLGYPFSSGYGGRERKADLGLAEVPRVDEIHGFVFGSFAPDGPSLREHLGPAADAFDRLVRLSPDRRGRADVPAGCSTRCGPTGRCSSRTRPTATTRSSCTARSSASPTAASATSTASARSAVSRDLGNGHTEDDLRPEFRRLGQPLGWFGTRPEKVPDYVARDARRPRRRGRARSSSTGRRT